MPEQPRAITLKFLKGSPQITDFGSFFRVRPYMFAAVLAILLLIFNIVAEPSFIAPDNIPEQLAVLAPFVLAAMASTPAVVSGGGGLDLSTGPLLTFVNIVLVVWLLPHGLGDFYLAIPILLAAGAAVGAINGFLIAVLRYQPAIATLCMFFILIGVNSLIADQPTSAGDNFTQDLTGTFIGIPSALFLIVAAALVWIALGRTPFHRALYATGGSDTTAYSAGVNVTATRIVAYAIGGLFAAFAGLALTAIVQQADASTSVQYTLIALAAVSLGGTPIGGGRGGLIGACLGAACIFMIQTLLSALSVPPTWLNVVYGGVLIIGVVAGARFAAPPKPKQPTARSKAVAA